MAKIDIKKFLGKPKEYTICGERVELEPLKGKDMDLIMGFKEGQERVAVQKLIMHYFQFTVDEFEQLPMNFLNDSVEAIMDINGLKEKK